MSKRKEPIWATILTALLLIYLIILVLQQAMMLNAKEKRLEALEKMRGIEIIEIVEMGPMRLIDNPEMAELFSDGKVRFNIMGQTNGASTRIAYLSEGLIGSNWWHYNEEAGYNEINVLRRLDRETQEQSFHVISARHE